MSDHDKLTDGQLAELERTYWDFSENGRDLTEQEMKRLFAELRALRKLREEVEPVLRLDYWLHNLAYSEEACECTFCVVTRRHIFGTEEKEPTK